MGVVRPVVVSDEDDDEAFSRLSCLLTIALMLNENVAGTVVAIPPESLDDPRLLEGVFTAMQPMGDDWGSGIPVVPERAVQGRIGTFAELVEWNKNGNLTVWRTVAGGYFILAQYHHGIDDCYRVLWVEHRAPIPDVEEAVDYWSLLWLIECAEQDRDPAVPGLIGVDMEASAARAMEALREMANEAEGE